MSTKQSQCRQILEYLSAGYSLTPLQALIKIGTMRLGARVWDLRQQGYDIKMEMVSDNGKRYAKYFMEGK